MNYTETRRLINNAVNANVAARTMRYHAREHKQDWSDVDMCLKDAMYAAADKLDSIERDACRLLYTHIDPEFYERDDDGVPMVSWENAQKVYQADKIIDAAVFHAMHKRFPKGW